MDSSPAGGVPSWHWPDATHSTPGQFPLFEEEEKPQQNDTEPSSTSAGSSSTPPRQRHWGPRTCRICLETVYPTYNAPSEHLPNVFQPLPSVTYESEDPSLGRLLRPCKCKGSSKYVHEGCLQAWRHADPSYGKRNYWQCPTCKFQYRLGRLKWGRWLSSAALQIVLTISILFLTMFLLGFVADPIINLYLDPVATVSSVPLSTMNFKTDLPLMDDEPLTWTEHFLKGLASLGLLGFVKVIFVMSPWHWWNLRSAGVIGGTTRGTGATGRDRLQSISWAVVLIGVITFIWSVYKGIRAWSRRTLEKAGERVMDVQGDADDDEEETNASTFTAQSDGDNK